ncbi:MAG TPA: hypothetical protein P5104_09850, partial [Bacteroidales bacterium]|nr:hypothetical protein [Bacteroidales bacterium]
MHNHHIFHFSGKGIVGNRDCVFHGGFPQQSSLTPQDACFVPLWLLSTPQEPYDLQDIINFNPRCR